MEIQVEPTSGEVAISYRNAAALTAKNLLAFLRRAGAKLQGHVQREKLSKGSGFLNHRSGNLKRAVFYRVEVAHGGAGEFDALARVSVDHAKARYGRIHEYGGSIKPVRAQNLTIPLKAAQTANGVARFTARQVIASPASFGYQDTFFRRDMIFGVKPGRQVVPLFVLSKGVTLRRVGYMASALQDLQPWINAEARTAAQHSLGQGQGA